jgi:DNA-binding transcriptional LysR family regulator
MLDLNDFRYFVEVVDRNGFSAAGRALGMPTSTMSYRIRQLEHELGVALLARSSRSVSVTDAGAEFYQHAVAMLERALDAEVVIKQRLSEPAGRVRYTAAIAIAQYAMPGMIAAFLERFPKITLEQHADDHYADLVTDRYDLAIRGHTGPLPSSGLIQRPLADVPWHLFAAPGYLAERGRPSTPGDLSEHSALFMFRANVNPAWTLVEEASGKRETAVSLLRPRMIAACTTTLKAAACAGLGIVALPAYICRDELRAGGLSRVLPGWLSDSSTITALLPNRRGMPPAVRAFLDHLALEFPKAVSIT